MAAFLVLSAGVARAADVAVVGWAQSSAPQARTLRIPRTGTFTMPEVSSGYLIVAAALSDIQFDAGSATWTSTAPGAVPQALEMRVSRPGEQAPDSCRVEIFGLARPQAGPGYATIAVRSTSGNPGSPSVAGSLIAFANVASTSISGPCCANAANDGSGTTVINKTMFDTSRGDALVNAVCTAWSGAAPGMPAPDPMDDPEMVPRTFQMLPDLQHFTGTSPGGEAERPATKYRHLRWLQSGSRVWAITGLQLFATLAVVPPDAAPPPPPDAAPPRDARPASDASPVSLPDATSPPADVGAPADEAPFVLPEPRLDGNLTAAPAPDALVGETPEPDAAAAGPRDIALQVGCACRTGGAGGGGLLVTLPIVVVLRWRRRVRVPQRHC